MTVKCLTAEQKSFIVYQFQYYKADINDLAVAHNCSRRTVIRVIEEANVDPGIRRRPQKPAAPSQPIPARRPWYRRAWDSLVGTSASAP